MHYYLSFVPLLLLAIVSGFGLTDVKSPAPQEKRPNIIFILSDDHAYQAVSAYDHPIGRAAPTPHIDRIGRSGVRFDRAYCGNALCGPSRATILTGKHSHVNGFKQNGNRFDATQWQWHKDLHAAGYRTAVIGKWHLGVEPEGFDYSDVLPGQGSYYNPEFRRNGAETYRMEGYTTDIITDKSLAWLQAARTEHPDRPFALLLWHKSPHRNWQPAPRHHNLYDSTYFPVPDNYFDNYRGRPAAAAQAMEVANPAHVYEGHDLKMTVAVSNDTLRNDPWPEQFSRFTSEQLREWNEHYRAKNDHFNRLEPYLEEAQVDLWKYQRYLQEYCASVASVDDGVGRVLDYLEESGLDENTIVIYTSDQGFFLGEHGWLDKRFMYEESMRIPLLMQYGSAIPAGRVSNALVQNIDFAATLLDFAGLPIPAAVQGKSFRAAATGTGPDEQYEALYYHYYEFPGFHDVRRHYGVKTDRYKLMHFYGDIDAWELYDLKTDPLEMRNLYGGEGYAAVTDDLKKQLDGLMKKYAVPPKEEWMK
ncbi:MAG: sulfatase [Saprospiraceae bacterium]